MDDLGVAPFMEPPMYSTNFSWISPKNCAPKITSFVAELLQQFQDLAKECGCGYGAVSWLHRGT